MVHGGVVFHLCVCASLGEGILRQLLVLKLLKRSNICLQSHFFETGTVRTRMWPAVKPIILCFFLSGNVHCVEDTTTDYLEDDIVVEIAWPATQIGSRRFVRCPYAYDRPLYAYRDCVLSLITDRTPVWTDANVTMCPRPPFSEGVDRLANFMVGNFFPCVSLITFVVGYVIRSCVVVQMLDFKDLRLWVRLPVGAWLC